MFDAWPALPLTPVWKAPPRVYDAIKYLSHPILAELPIPEDETANTPYMYFSLWHWSPMVNGYSGFVPESYKELRAEMTRFPDDRGIDALHRRGVTHVTVNCALDYPGCDELIHAMEHSPRLHLVANTAWLGRPVQLYELSSPY